MPLIPSSKKIFALTALAAGVLVAGVAVAQPDPPATGQTRKVIITADGTGETAAFSASGGDGSGQSVVKIESLDVNHDKEPARDVTWLGLSTADVPEALAAQLELKPGEGLVVDFVAPDSPAAKAGLEKFDVIVELNDQMLVDPAQLRKLVQMQKAGDSIKVTLFRGGKKQTVSATLMKHKEAVAIWSSDAGAGGGMSGLKNMNWIFQNGNGPKSVIGLDKKKLDAEVQRNLEEARRELEEALRQSARAGRALPPRMPKAPQPPLPPLANFGSAATVTVTKDSASVKTIVKRDDTGDLVIVASPQKHLTAHDGDGKLIFDGEIETPEQQQKVPADLWEKVKPLLPQVKPSDDAEPPPRSQAGGEQKI